MGTYQISPAWMEYYLEPEPDRRAQLLARLPDTEPDDGSNSFRKRLFALRYLNGEDTQPSVDRYLWQCVNFVQIYDTSRYFKKSGRREAEQLLSGNGYLEAVCAGIDGERAVYWEIRNAAARFFKTCSGKEYRRALFGLLSPGSEDQKKQMTLEAWKMTIGLGERLGMAQTLELWTRAVMDEHRRTDPMAEARMQKLLAERG